MGRMAFNCFQTCTYLVGHLVNSIRFTISYHHHPPPDHPPCPFEHSTTYLNGLKPNVMKYPVNISSPVTITGN